MLCRLLTLMLLFALQSGACADFSLDANCKRAYSLTLSYRLKEASTVLAAEKKLNPDNLIPLYIASYGEMLKVFFEENKAAWEQMKISEDLRISQLKKAPQDNPWQRHCLAQIYMHQAIAAVRFGDNLNAALKVNKAYTLLAENKKKYPDFILSNQYLLIMQAAVGTVPGNYRWMLKLLGFSGDINTATAAFRQYEVQLDGNAEYEVFRSEAHIIASFMQYYLLNNTEASWQEIQQATPDFAKNPLSAYFRASIALRIHRNNDAFTALKPWFNDPVIPQLDYLTGNTALQRLDANAGFYLSRYLKKYKGANYLKDTYLKLGWAFLLKGDTAYYFKSLALVKKSGTTLFEEDKNALKEAARAGRPNGPLLRARLLFDGGLYARAWQEIKNIEAGTFLLRVQQEELLYRKGRILEAMGNETDALKFYGQLSDKNDAGGEYFVPAASLYSAIILEKQGKAEAAIRFYKKCIGYKDYPYKDSFEQKAYAGLKRLHVK